MYQQCTHLSGYGKSQKEPVYGITNQYSSGNSIGSIYDSTSFLVDSEFLIFFGIGSIGYSDQIWKYSIEKKQWKFVKGRKLGNQNSVFNLMNTFDSSIEIGSRRSTKGWKNEDIIFLFGGTTGLLEDDVLNEFWIYNSSMNSYLVIQCNDCTNPISLYGQYDNKNEFSSLTFPGARKYHEIVQLNEKEILLIGGKGYSEFNGDCKLSDWLIFSSELMEWKYGGGELGDQFKNIYPIFGKTNVYEENNAIGSLFSTSGVLINKEEVLIFGGFKNYDILSNIIFKYNITSNYWKYVSGKQVDEEQSFFAEDCRKYDSNNYPGGRLSHKIWKVNENEILLFGGYGLSSEKEGYLNDEWLYNIKNNIWKFNGKEKTKYPDQVGLFKENNEYSEDTLMGGTSFFIGDYIQETNELIICNGLGSSIYKTEVEGLEDCWSIYYGLMCNLDKDTDKSVCSHKGICFSYNNCHCYEGYFGNDCELTMCNGILSNETSVCAGKGVCVESQCLCYEQSVYNDPNCEIDEVLQNFMNNLWIFITVPIIFILLFLIIIIVIIVSLFICRKQKKKLKKFDQIEDIDIILEEQKISKDTSIAHFRINQKMFEIDPNDIRIIKKIGDGGSSAVVYSAIWNNQKIAYKCFIIQDFLENKFAEFEKEVELLSSINFPFILTFYGATLNSQRLGFVMEYAENGDLEYFLKQELKNKGKKYEFAKKIRLLYEISSAMFFLHNKKVIHRDLKPQNVLVTSKEETKLMDFGLAKIVDNDLTKTKQVGTSFYIAPEVLSGKYSNSCDIFSFSMLMFVILTENYKPFGKSVQEFQIFLKISKDPSFRPNLNELETIDFNKDSLNQLKKIIKRNWDHEPSKRMNFEEINKVLTDLLTEKKESKEKIKGNSQCSINWKEKFEEVQKENQELKKLIQKFKKQQLKN